MAATGRALCALKYAACRPLEYGAARLEFFLQQRSCVLQRAKRRVLQGRRPVLQPGKAGRPGLYRQHPVNHRKVMTGTAAHHKQMPDSVVVGEGVGQIEHHADRVGDATGQQ